MFGESLAVRSMRLAAAQASRPDFHPDCTLGASLLVRGGPKAYRVRFDIFTEPLGQDHKVAASPSTYTVSEAPA